MIPDIKTLMFLYIITNVINAGAVAVIWSQNRGRFAGISFWLVTMVLQVVGSALHVLRGLVPDLISMTLVNTVILAGVLMMLMGLERFTGKKGRQVHNYVLLATFIAISVYFVVVQPNLLARDIAVSAMLMIYTFQCCWLLLRRVDTGMRRITRLTGIVFAVYAAFNFIRIGLNIMIPEQSTDFYQSGAANALAITGYIVLNLCLAISLVAMVNRRLLADVKSQEEKFTTAFQSSPYAITLTRPSDGKIFEVNQGFINITGYQYSEVIGKTTIGLNLWVREEDRLAVTNELVQGRQIQAVEVQFRKKTGEVLTGLFSANQVKINNETCILASIADITERKQVEEALRESEERYRSLFETMAQGVVYQDADGQITNANLAAEKILGLSLDQMQGRTSVDPRWQAIHEDGSNFPGETHPAIVALRTGREVHDVVMGVFHPAKEAYSWIIINAVPQFHPDEERPYRVYTTFDDITERKNAEDALRESEAQNLALISAFPDILFTNRRDGEFLTVHTSHPELLFAPPETFLHRKVEEIMPKPLSDQFMKAFADALDLEAVQELNYMLPVGGEERHLEARVTPCTKDTVITIVRDVTDRKQAEQALRESEEKYRKLIETMLDGVYRSSQEGRFLEINPAMVKMLGYANKEELLAIDIKSQLYFAPEHRESAALDEKLEEIGAFRLRKKDGSEIWVEYHGRHVVDDEGTVLYHEGVLRDISERKQLEERIRQVRNDLLFAVSHDLKSPLQALRQTQEMLSQLPPVEALTRFQEYGEIWRRNLQRLERMINNLVDSQRSEEDRFPLLLVSCDPGEMVQQVVEDLTGYALALQIQFDLKLEAVPQGSCDEEALARVVENLLTNAVKFSPQGGRVEVRLGMEGDTLLLEVEDHGAGIPANEQEQLFQPFQRSRSAQQKGIPGTGLGLYVCRRIVEEHGGTITLTSEEGKGTKVTVRLPWKVE